MNLDFKNPCPILAKILANDLAINVIDENGENGLYSSTPINFELTRTANNAFVNIATAGDLTTLNWVEGFQFNKLLNSTTEKQFIPVDVHYSALNFRDIMMASGALPPQKCELPYFMESQLGVEFAGVAEDGNKVFGFAQGQALATNVFANMDSVWKVPSNWTLEDSSTIPVVYSTVRGILKLMFRLSSSTCCSGGLKICCSLT